MKRNRINNKKANSSEGSSSSGVVSPEPAAKVARSFADDIYEMRIEKNTKDSYNGKIKRMKMFFVSKNMDVFKPSGDLNIPLDLNTIKELFGWLGTNTDLPKRGKFKVRTEFERVSIDIDEEDDSGDEGVEEIDEGDDDFGNEMSILEASKKLVTISVACMQGYKSALKNEYTKQNVVMCNDVDAWIERFIDGYSKMIQKKKEDGVMKMKEGKSHLSFRGYNYLSKYLVTYKHQRRSTVGREFSFSSPSVSQSWLESRKCSGPIYFCRSWWRSDCWSSCVWTSCN